MYRGQTVGVVVPAYNEEAHVGTVLETMPAFVDRIYVIDDCSTDGTWEVIQSYVVAGPGAGGDLDDATTGIEDHSDEVGDLSDEVDDVVAPSITDGGTFAGSRIVPVRHAENQGAGGAIRTGYLFARRDGVDLTITMDADGQMDPDEASALLDPLVEGEADYAKGNRLATPGDWVGMPPFRLLGNWTLTMLTRIASGYWRTTDPQNGYTAITGEALRAIEVEAIPDDHDYPNDLLVRLNVASMRVADVSMPAVYGDEESSIDYESFVPATSQTLARGFWWRMKERYLADRAHPVAVCYGTGAFCGASGLAALLGSLVGESSRNRTGTSVLVLLAGVLLVVAAMVLDARANAGLEVRSE